MIFAMRLATSTCIFPARREGGDTPLVRSIAMCRECGFDVIDLNFCSAVDRKSGFPLCSDEWMKFVDELGDAGAKYGVTFSQSHAPYDSNLRRADRPIKEEDLEWYFESVRRSIWASAKLGVRWVVTHAQTDVYGDEMGFEQNMKTNLQFYAPIVEWAKRYGTGIAIENMAEFHPEKTKHRFTAIVEEQIAVIDALNDPDVQGCWDFGHAQLVYRDQLVPLKKLGGRLKATHVQECDGKEDDHFLPFIRGTTPWEKIMPYLKTSGYPGDFTYEVHGFFSGIPESLRIRSGKFAYEVGCYLMDLYNKA
jgi:sugar phosphate isomerase/epimerase